MRLWLDILTPKQTLFFEPVIDSLRKDGHEVLVTSRRYREVEELAALRGIDFEFVGSRAGKDPLGQLKNSLERMELLVPKVVRFAPEVGVSVASADCARICFGLRIKHVAVNDSPHSVVAGRLSLPLSYHLMSPWVIPYSSWSVFGLSRRQITKYRAMDPATWLKRRRDTPKRRTGKRRILVRLEESYAPYLSGSDESWTGRVLTRLAEDFQGDDLVALGRYEDQLAGIKKKFGRSFDVPEKAFDGAEMIESSDVFVGMGGTMTAEAALLGVPAVSAFQGPELYTEKYLLSRRLLLKAKSAVEVSKFVRSSLEPNYSKSYRKRGRALLDWMEDPAAKVTTYLESLAPRS